MFSLIILDAVSYYAFNDIMESMSNPSSIGATNNFCEPVTQNIDHYDNPYFMHSTDHAGLNW